jgi:hypothetical protein
MTPRVCRGERRAAVPLEWLEGVEGIGWLLGREEDIRRGQLGECGKLRGEEDLSWSG